MIRSEAALAMLGVVDALRLGSALRTLRIRAGWTQAELAIRAGVSDSDVSRLERGLADRLPMWKVHAIALALDAWADFGLRWRGGELERAVGASHAAMHQALARWLADIGGWELSPEVSFSVFGERGAIDGLAWHADTRTLLVIELKSELVDVSELLGTFDRKLRLAPGIARDRGWDAANVAGWLLVAEGRTNRRRAADHRDVLRAALPDDGRRLEGWLRAPSSPLWRARSAALRGTASAPLRAMSFLPDRHLAGLGLRLAPPKRVRPRRSCVGAASRIARPASGASLAAKDPGRGD